MVVWLDRQSKVLGAKMLVFQALYMVLGCIPNRSIPVVQCSPRILDDHHQFSELTSSRDTIDGPQHTREWMVLLLDAKALMESALM